MSEDAARRGPRGAWFAVGAAAVIAVMVFAVAPHASSAPDGLQKVAADQRLAAGEQTHALARGPLAGYSVTGVHDSSLATGLAGVVGVVVTLGVATGLATLATRRRRQVPSTR